MPFRALTRLRQARGLRHFIATRHAKAFSELGSSDIAIDCGANMGNVTALMAAGGAQVYAFEPNADAYTELARHMKRYSNVEIRQQAVWTSAGSAELYHHTQYATNPLKLSVASTLVSAKENVAKKDSALVDCIDFAAFILSLPSSVKLVKMDIEGAEYDVLDHLIETDAIDHIERLLVETHEHKIPTLRTKALDIRNKIKHRNLSNIDLTWK